jgi:hypothetical protein
MIVFLGLDLFRIIKIELLDCFTRSKSRYVQDSYKKRQNTIGYCLAVVVGVGYEPKKRGTPD